MSLGWDFFGPLLTGMVEAMETQAPEDLDLVEQMLNRVLIAVQSANH